MKHVLLLKDGWTYIITHNILEIVVVLILVVSVSLWAYFTKIIAADFCVGVHPFDGAEYQCQQF